LWLCGGEFADRCDDLRGSVLLDVVPRAFEEDSAVIGKQLLPAFALWFMEREVVGWPAEQGRPFAELRQPLCDMRQKRPAFEDLARKHLQGPTRLGCWKRTPVGVHDSIRHVGAPDPVGQDFLDE
jgi:hypothetical protein